MPTYEYRCRECGHTVEIIHSILEDGPDACERCRAPVQRVLHPAGIIFRGSGFYTTDSRAATSGERIGVGTGAKDRASKPSPSGEGGSGTGDTPGRDPGNG